MSKKAAEHHKKASEQGIWARALPHAAREMHNAVGAGCQTGIYSKLNGRSH